MMYLFSFIDYKCKKINVEIKYKVHQMNRGKITGLGAITR